MDKKNILIVMLIIGMAVFLTGCDSENCDSGGDDEVIWVEGNEPLPRDPCDSDSRTIGLWFREVDLSEADWYGEYWYEIGIERSPRSDLDLILGKPINTRDEAVSVANEILISESSSETKIGEGIISGITLELMSVSHDSTQNLWLFGFGVNDLNMIASSFHVAIDGNTGELLRMWIE